MKSTLISAILWALCSICFAILAISTFVSGGAIWLGVIQAFAAVVDGIDAGLHWKIWRYERTIEKIADLWNKN